jgi:serine protease AprX
MRTSRLPLLLALVAALVLGAPAAGTTAADGAAVDSRLAAALATATGPLEVVVTFRGDGAPTATDVAALRDAGISTGVTFQALPIAGVLATATQVDALAASPAVASLYFNRALAYENERSTALTGVDAVRADPKLTKRNGNLPVAGYGATVLVNDSGVDGGHLDHRFGPHLVQNVEGATNLRAWSDLAPVSYVENVENTDSTGGHGTHVTGIVGGTGFRSDGKYEGVAPGAKLVGYGSGAGLAILDVLGGFDYAIANRDRYGIDVITNSWGDTGDSCTDVNPDEPVTRATYETFKAGIAVVFSAGNSGPDQCTISGNYKKAPWVISVAAGDSQRRLADFSSRGTPGGGGSFTLDGKTWTWEDRPTVTAPGVLVVSTRALSPIGVLGTPDDILGGVAPQHLPYYTTLSGTSMAAPHVAGIVALLLDANPALTPLQVKEILQATATPLPYAAWEAGAGYVDAYAAVKRAFR